MDVTLKHIEFDKEGFLKNFKFWDKEIAELLAQSEKIKLSDKHWDILYFFRSYHEKYLIHPLIRNLINFELEIIKKNNLLSKTSTDILKELYQLFPKGLIKQASRISGLPNPKNCFYYKL